MGIFAKKVDGPETVQIKGYDHINKKYIIIDGEEYVFDKSQSKGKTKRGQFALLTFRKCKIKDYDSAIESLARKLSDKVDTIELLKQSLRDIPFESVMEMAKEMNKPKPKVRKNLGCMYLTIGKEKLFLRDWVWDEQTKTVVLKWKKKGNQRLLIY